MISYINQGFVTFKGQFSEDAINNILNQQIMKILIDNIDWDLAGKRFLELKTKEILSSFSELFIQNLKIRWSGIATTLVQLESIKMPRLKILYVNGNNIESLQSLLRFQSPGLKILNLKENNISQIKSIRKCILPQLEELHLYKNKINSLEWLTELNAPKLAIVWFSPQSDLFDTNMSMSWIFKIQSKNLRKAYLYHTLSQPFNKNCLEMKLKQKYKNVKMTYKIKDDIRLRLE